MVVVSRRPKEPHGNMADPFTSCIAPGPAEHKHTTLKLFTGLM